MFDSFIDFVRKNKINEMAIRHDVVKKPINIDEDDIEFLQQFPHELWDKALHKRYDLLFDEVEKLHQKRKKAGHDNIKNQIIKAMKTQNWQVLKGLLPDDKINSLSNHLTPKLVKSLSDKEIDKEADIISHEHIKSSLDDIDHEGEVEFKLGKNSTYLAKPYLNRLYHKLERTRGLEHKPTSGLKGTGRYGYDFAEPLRSPDEKLPHSSAGMKFPTYGQINDRMKDFLNLQMHRMFGDLPEDVVWKDTGSKDEWSIQYVQKELRKKIESELRLQGKYSNNSELEKDADLMAKEKVLELARQGKLKGPPIPGVAPNGIPIRLVQKKGKETLEAPPLYLPFVEKQFKIKDQKGNIQTITKEVPIVKPAHFFRELGSNDEDYVTEPFVNDAGKVVQKRKYNPDGTPIFKVSPDKLRGHEKQFLHVDDDDFIHGRTRAAGAISPNHNSEGIMHISKGDPKYKEAYEKVFNDQRMVVLGKGKKLIPANGAGFFEDIMKGIIACISGSMCGGATNHERIIMLQNIEEIHQMIAQSMLMDLRNPKLYEKETRILYAKNKAGSYAQRDQMQGGGSRRKRNFDHSSRNVSLDATTTGKGGESIGVGDAIMATVADKSKLGNNTASDTIRLSGSEKKLDTSGQNAPYNLANFRKIIEGLAARAKEADNAASLAKEKSNHEVGDSIIALLQSSINDKNEVIESMTQILSDLYQTSMSEPEALKAAQTQVKEWILDGYNTTEKLISVFSNHPLVVDKLGGLNNPIANKKPNDLSQAMEKFYADIKEFGDTLPQNVLDVLKPNNINGLSVYANNVLAKLFDSSVVELAQKEINKFLQNLQNSNTTPVGTSQENPHDIVTVRDQWVNKQYDKLAVNPYFLRTTPVGNLTKLINWFKSSNNRYDNSTTNNAISALQKAIIDRS